MTNTTKEKPIHEIRIGGIKAALWKNEYHRGIVRYNVTFSRIYREENEWRTTNSFGRDDLLVVAKVADRAHSWICAQLQPEHNGGSTSPDERVLAVASQSPRSIPPLPTFKG